MAMLFNSREAEERQRQRYYFEEMKRQWLDQVHQNPNQAAKAPTPGHTPKPATPSRKILLLT